jgi:ADP-ribosylglycohydrolase
MPEPARFPPVLSPRELAGRQVERECEMDLANFGNVAEARATLRRTLRLYPDGSSVRVLSDQDARSIAWSAMSALAAQVHGAGPYVSHAVKHALRGVACTDADRDVVQAIATVANVAVRVS